MGGAHEERGWNSGHLMENKMENGNGLSAVM